MLPLRLDILLLTLLLAITTGPVAIAQDEVTLGDPTQQTIELNETTAEQATSDEPEDTADSGDTTTESTDTPLDELFADELFTNEGASNNEQPSGLSDLDQATVLKVTASSLPDVNRVIDLLDTAIEKGLDADNQAFAEQVLVSTLIQRAEVLSNAILSGRMANSRQDPRWTQVRMFALTDLQRAVELDKSQWEAHLLIGQLQTLPLGDVRAARHAFSAVVQMDGVPDTERARAHALRGATFSDEPDKQLADFSKAIELDADNADYLKLRAKHFSRTGKLDDALVDVDRALELEEDDANSHELRGLILLGQENYDEARTSFDRATELAPNDLGPYQFRSQLFQLQDDLDKAIEQLTKALELKEDDTDTLMNRSRLYYQAEKVDEALADVDKALSINRVLPRAYQVKAEILALEDRLPEAIATLKQILDLAPRRPELIELHYQLATYYLMDKQAEKAVDSFTTVVGWAPTSVAALRGRGNSYLRLGKHAEAIADFEAALKEAEDDEGLLNNLAWVLATSPFDEIRNGQRAIGIATKACEVSSYHAAHILSTLAAAYAETGNFEEAIKWSTQAVELGREDPSFPQLQAELKSYQEGKPWREFMPGDSGDEQPTGDEASDDQNVQVEAAAEPEPVSTADR